MLILTSPRRHSRRPDFDERRFTKSSSGRLQKRNDFNSPFHSFDSFSSCTLYGDFSLRLSFVRSEATWSLLKHIVVRRSVLLLFGLGEKRISGLIRRNNRRDIKTSRNKYKLEVEGRRKNFSIYDSYKRLAWNTKLKASCQLVSSCFFLTWSAVLDFTTWQELMVIVPFSRPNLGRLFLHMIFMDSLMTNLFLIVPVPWPTLCW